MSQHLTWVRRRTTWADMNRFVCDEVTKIMLNTCELLIFAGGYIVNSAT